MKILASDFDNTIYLDDKNVTKKNILAIKKFVSLGNIFCIITGRNYSDLKKILIEEDIPYTYLICEDGAKIFNNMDYCLDTILLNEKEVEKIVSVIKENNWDYYLDDGYNHTDYYGDCVKIVLNCEDKKEQEHIIEVIKKISDVYIYASRTHVNIIHKSVNKKSALKKLFNIENLDYQFLYVIGDNDNDYEMIKSFNGVIMKHHHKILDELKKNEYDTLKDYIEELLKK